MKRSGILALPALVAFAGAALAEPGATPPAGPTEALQRGDCALCHQVPGVPAATRIESCADCHIWIRQVAANPEARVKAMQVFPLWERYERNVASYLAVPSLAAAQARLDPTWVRGYLADPHDLRPGLPETMPRFGLDGATLDAIAASFAPVQAEPTPAPESANLELGERLFAERTCSSCHSLGDRFTGGIPTAPDLAVTRERMDPDLVVAWILDPQAISPAAAMPPLGLSREEAIALRDFLFLVPLDPAVAPAAGPPPGPSSREVSWEEVEAEVFGKICAHCHMKPELNDGRAGPGNAGGFGWPATGIELQTCAGVAAEAERVEASILRRREEAHRDVVQPGQRAPLVERPARPGMPLGLPALPDEDIALVRGWIAQGAHCPPGEE